MLEYVKTLNCISTIPFNLAGMSVRKTCVRLYQTAILRKMRLQNYVKEVLITIHVQELYDMIYIID